MNKRCICAQLVSGACNSEQIRVVLPVFLAFACKDPEVLAARRAHRCSTIELHCHFTAGKIEFELHCQKNKNAVP